MLYMGLYGLFIALPLSVIIGLIYLRSRCPLEPAGRFSWPVYLELVREGGPLAIFAFLMTLMITSGRLLVAGYLTTEEVGYYALATLALRGMLNFPGAAREVVEPRIMEKADTLHLEAVPINTGVRGIDVPLGVVVAIGVPGNAGLADRVQMNVNEHGRYSGKRLRSGSLHRVYSRYGSYVTLPFPGQ